MKKIIGRPALRLPAIALATAGKIRMSVVGCFVFGTLTLCDSSKLSWESQPKKILKYGNPKDVGMADFFKLGGIWVNAASDVLHGMNLLDSVEKPLVTIFGGHSLDKKSPYYKTIEQLAKKLAQSGVAIITGGGAGVMEAANCAASSVKGQGITSIAIGIRGLDTNTCAQKRMELAYFFPRKWLLMEYSSGFIFGPGGIGTMDELGQLVTLLETEEMPIVPIYVVGQDYWKNFKTWFTQDAVKAGLVKKSTVDLVTFTDDVDRIVREIMDWIAQHQPAGTAPTEQAAIATEIMGR